MNPRLERLLEAQAETGRTVNRLMLTLLGVGLAGALTLGFPDSYFFTTAATVSVPFAGGASFKTLLILGPLLLIAVRVYLEIYVAHWRRLNGIVRRYGPSSAGRVPVVSPLRHPLLRIFSGFVLYALVPLVLAVFTYKAMTFRLWGVGMLFLTLASVAVLACHRLSWHWPYRFVAPPLALLAVIVTAEHESALDDFRRPFSLQLANLERTLLAGQDLMGADLRSANLSEADLSGAQLEGADLTFAQLEDANLSGAQLEGARLVNAQLEGARLVNAQLKGAYLSPAQLKGADLNFAQLEGADLSGAQLEGASLWDAQLKGANLSDAQLAGANLTEAQLEGARLWNAQLKGAYLSDAQLKGADFSDAQLEGADLNGAQMEGAYLNGAQLEGAVLFNAQLNGADLSYAQLEGAVLFNAQLNGANLSGAQLEGAELNGAQLEDARLWGAQLKGANLSGAQMEGADLNYAQMEGADLTRSTGLIQAQLDTACGDEKTRLPEGFTIRKCGAIEDEDKG